MNQAAERVESLKAGLAGAAAATILAAIPVSYLLDKFWLFAKPDSGLNSSLLQLSVAALSGFLFGVTYRYVVRADRNSHLRSGAVLAFGLVRGLAQLEITLITDPYWLTGLRILESLLLFALVALLLDYLMQRGWLKQFDAF